MKGGSYPSEIASHERIKVTVSKPESLTKVEDPVACISQMASRQAWRFALYGHIALPTFAKTNRPCRILPQGVGTQLHHDCKSR